MYGVNSLYYVLSSMLQNVCQIQQRETSKLAVDKAHLHFTLFALRLWNDHHPKLSIIVLIQMISVVKYNVLLLVYAD
jgi:hypothetical protein